MPIFQGAVTVTDAPTRLDLWPANGAGTPAIRNMDSSVIVYVGNSGVTTSNGFPVKPDEVFSPDLRNYDGGVYGIVASGTVACRVFQVGG